MLDLDQAAQELDHLDAGVAAMAYAIVKREGGLEDNPNDSGGLTNYGVSLKHARAQGLVFDLDHDGDVDADDIRLVTPEIAVVDFLMVFFIEPGINKLPKCIQACAFDHAVNGGPSAAVRLVQYALNTLGAKPQLRADGVIGPNTINVANALTDAVGETRMLNALIDQRDAEYRAIAKRIPKDAVFLKGWLARAESFRPKAVTTSPTHTVPAPVGEQGSQADDNSSDDLNARELARLHGEG